jgi:WS/DGAT/MGAT family acyltransferase
MDRTDAPTATGWGGPADMTDWETVMWRAEVEPRTRSSGALLEILDCEPDWDRLVAAHQRITELIPRLRERVVEPVLPLIPPAWSRDRDFALRHHLHRLRLPAPGGLRELLDVTETLLERPLDRSRPPWEAIFVEGLEGGRAAYVIKMHHSLTDGQGLVQLLELAHSRTRKPGAARRTAPAPLRPELTPMTLLATRLLRHTASAPVQLARQVIGSARLAHRTVTKPAAVVGDTIRFTRSLQRVLTPPPVDRSPLLAGSGGSSYRLVVHDVPLADLKAAGKAAGGSVNDAFLAALLGGFRRYHEHFGVNVDHMPIAFPVSLRSNDDPLGGNRFAGARFAAPVGEPDPRERIAAVREFVLNARAEPAIGVLDLLAPAVSRLPTALVVGLAAGMTSISDVQASNVAGLGHSAYLAGARVTHTYMFGPRPGVAAMVGMLSYDGRCCLAFNVDPDAITDIELFTTCMQEGFDEVLDLRSS